MSISESLHKPTVAIFLDIEGVLLPTILPGSIRENIAGKTDELFPLEPESPGHTTLQKRIAQSHFLSQDAVDCLDHLIGNIQTVAKVVIILSSSWKYGISVSEIKEDLFAKWSFSKYIIDKTFDDQTSRARQIDLWLRSHRDQKILTHVILDDIDDELSALFPENFVHVKKRLFSLEYEEKAKDILMRSISGAEVL